MCFLRICHAQKKGQEKRQAESGQKERYKLPFSPWTDLGSPHHAPPQSRLAIEMQVCFAIQVDTASLGAHRCSSQEAALWEGKEKVLTPPSSLSDWLAPHGMPSRRTKNSSLWFGPSGGFPKGTLGMCLIIHWCSHLYLSTPWLFCLSLKIFIWNSVIKDWKTK